MPPRVRHSHPQITLESWECAGKTRCQVGGRGHGLSHLDDMCSQPQVTWTRTLPLPSIFVVYNSASREISVHFLIVAALYTDLIRTDPFPFPDFSTLQIPQI